MKIINWLKLWGAIFIRRTCVVFTSFVSVYNNFWIFFLYSGMYGDQSKLHLRQVHDSDGPDGSPVDFAG